MFGVPKSPERLKEALEGIFGLKAGARICIRLVTEAKSEVERDEHCATAMKTLFDEEQVGRLKRSGYKVRFVVDEGHVHDLADAMKGDWAGMHGGARTGC
jgi:hypothetical protein